MNKRAVDLLLLGLLAVATQARQFDDIEPDDADCIINNAMCRSDFAYDCEGSYYSSDAEPGEACRCAQDWIACIDPNCEISSELITLCENACAGAGEYTCGHAPLQDGTTDGGDGGDAFTSSNIFQLVCVSVLFNNNA
ncbi:hypothetical protein QOT17_015628 [Balamuthia mandrillaris]